MRFSLSYGLVARRGAAALLSLMTLPAATAQVTQVSSPPAAPEVLTLAQCLDYALSNRPELRQARLDEQIADAQTRVARAGWLPQVGVTGTAQHYFQLPYTVFPNLATGVSEPRQIGVQNVTTVGLAGTQVIYNNDVLLAARQAPVQRLAAAQNTTDVRIAVTADVSKAFYDVLLSDRQLDVYKEDIARLSRNYQDARARYDVGIVDKTDFLQAEISLNNSLASRRQAQEDINAKTAYLQELMGRPVSQPLRLEYDTLQLERAAVADTLTPPDFAQRIEIQQVETQRRLQSLTVDYYRRGYLPALSAFGNYNSVYQNNSFADQYAQRFPNSYAGLQVTLPIFTGFRRTQNLRRARLQNERLDVELTRTQLQLNTEYARALADYKANYAAYLTGKRNLELSRQVYQVVDLQYREGIKAYIDLLVAQTTRRTAQLNYYQALFQVLRSKVDLERARGNLTP